jgi:hypothetical protein
MKQDKHHGDHQPDGYVETEGMPAERSPLSNASQVSHARGHRAYQGGAHHKISERSAAKNLGVDADKQK